MEWNAQLDDAEEAPCDFRARYLRGRGWRACGQDAPRPLRGLSAVLASLARALALYPGQFANAVISADHFIPTPIPVSIAAPSAPGPSRCRSRFDGSIPDLVGQIRGRIGRQQFRHIESSLWKTPGAQDEVVMMFATIPDRGKAKVREARARMDARTCQARLISID